VASLLAMTIGRRAIRNEPPRCAFDKLSAPRYDNREGASLSSHRTVDVRALLPYNTHLSLRRRVTDCGNPREGKDQMDPPRRAFDKLSTLSLPKGCAPRDHSKRARPNHPRS